MTVEDAFDLPPLQYAVLEMVAARYRLGEEVWTVHVKVTKALDALEEQGLIEFWSGSVEKTQYVMLTEAGKKATLSETYVSPLERSLRRCQEAAREREIPGERWMR